MEYLIGYGITYEKISDTYIIIDMHFYKDAINRTRLYEIMPGLKHIDFYCIYHMNAEILPESNNNGISYTIHDIPYDNLCDTIDIAKKKLPTISTIAFVEIPDIHTYKKPVYNKYLDITFPSMFHEYIAISSIHNY